MNNTEQKYLINAKTKEMIKDLELKEKKIITFYTLVKLCKEVRYSRIKSKYYKFTKDGIYNLSKEKKILITKKKYKKAKNNKIGNKIKKSVYRFFPKNDDYQLHQYKGKLKKLNILFDYSNNSDNFISTLVSKNITNDERYLDKNLALFGDPREYSYNIYAIFKDIELDRIKKSQKIIFKEMKTGDALRIVLYTLLSNMKVSLKHIKNSDAKEGLEDLTIALKHSITIVKEFREVFDESMVNRILKHLKIISSSLKIEKNLRYIKNKLFKLDTFVDSNELSEIKRKLSEKQKIQRRKILNLLSTREFSIVFRQYELFLKENSKTSYSNYAQMPIQISIKENMLKNHTNSFDLCKRYEKCEDNLGFKKISKSFKRLDTILKTFDDIIDNKDKNTIIENVDKILLSLNKNKNIKRDTLIVLTYLNNLKIKPKEYNRIKKQVEKQSRKNRKNNIEQLRGAIVNFQKKAEFISQQV